MEDDIWEEVSVGKLLLSVFANDIRGGTNQRRS